MASECSPQRGFIVRHFGRLSPILPPEAPPAVSTRQDRAVRQRRSCFTPWNSAPPGRVSAWDSLSAPHATHLGPSEHPVGNGGCRAPHSRWEVHGPGECWTPGARCRSGRVGRRAGETRPAPAVRPQCVRGAGSRTQHTSCFRQVHRQIPASVFTAPVHPPPKPFSSCSIPVAGATNQSQKPRWAPPGTPLLPAG